MEFESVRGDGVRLTARGAEVAARWEPLRESAEDEWRRSMGADRMSKLRASLEGFVAQLPHEFSHYPAGYGVADDRITGGNGKDWKAVPRDEGDTVSGLPLSALISQASVASAVAYEAKAGVALSLSAMVLRRIPADGCSAKEHGLSAGISALRRHGYLRIDNGANGPTLHLTVKGHEINDAYDDRVRTVEREWQAKYGDNIVKNVRLALENAASTMCSESPPITPSL